MKHGLFFSTLLFVAVFSSCRNGNFTEPEPAFGFIVVQTDTLQVAETYPASIQGRRDVEIYPQISGSITQVCIREGEQVKQGQTLFVIDQVPYQAALRTAQANVNAARAGVATAELDYNSKKILRQENVISEYDLLLAANTLAAAQATLEQALATETDARNSLSYTTVKSPVNGQTGTLPYRTGTLVSPQMSTPLTTVSDNGEMYVYFSMSESSVRGLVSCYGSMEEAIRHLPPVQLQLCDGTLYEEEGRIETFSGVINPQTGTLSVRSVFPNPRKMLWSGGVGNVILKRTLTDLVIIPQNITVEIQDKIKVYRLENSQEQIVFIKVLPQNDGKHYAVTEGLTPGDTLLIKQ